MERIKMLRFRVKFWVVIFNRFLRKERQMKNEQI
jgi:hypothetical protein